MNAPIGELIRYYRKKEGLSQHALSDGICAREYLGNLERGQHSPSLDTTALLSGKLGINLFGLYEDYKNHVNISTHLLCTQLNECIQKREFDNLRILVCDCEISPDFSDGEPFQILSYAKSILLARDNKYSESLHCLENALILTFPSFPALPDAPDNITNTVFALLLSYAVNSCRNENVSLGLSILKTIENYAKNILSSDIYDLEKNKAFRLNMLCSCVYNRYIFMDNPSEEMIDEIDFALSYQKENYRSHMIAELLFCKAAILMNGGKTVEARYFYQEALYIKAFYENMDQARKLAHKIISTHSSITLFESN